MPQTLSDVPGPSHFRNPPRTPVSSMSTLHTAPLLLEAVTPLQTTRYKLVDAKCTQAKRTFPKGRHQGGGKLNAFMLNLPELPTGWQEYVHPDGKPYFRHEEWRVVTEVDVRDPKSLHDLNDLYEIANGRWLKHAANDQGKYELYLAIVETGDVTSPKKNCYYFVEHETRDIFWLEDLDVEKIIGKSRMPTINYELFILQNYYCHLEYFPCHNDLPKDAIYFLRSALTYMCTGFAFLYDKRRHPADLLTLFVLDHMTSGESATSPWSAQEAKDFLDLLDGLASEVPPASVTHDQGHRTWFVARLVWFVLESRLIHHYGMADARTDRLLSVDPVIPGVLDYVAGGLTFFAYITNLRRFENMWIDGIVSTNAWRQLLDSVITEWSDSNLLATVMLAANMAFLALQTLSGAAITTSLFSTFFSIGSIVTGLHHLWRFREKRETSASEAGIYFENAAGLTNDLRLLSFFLSLPLSLLSWSIVAFACSVAIYAIQGKRYFSIAALAMVLVTVSLTILFFWRLVFARAHKQS